MAHSMLTVGNKNVDWKIFNYLNDEDIMHLCMVNSEMKKLCNNQEFWEYRLRQIEPQTTWKQIYINRKEDKRGPRGFNVTFDGNTNYRREFPFQKGMKVGDMIYSGNFENDDFRFHFIKYISNSLDTVEAERAHIYKDKLTFVLGNRPEDHLINFINSTNVDQYVRLLSKYIDLGPHIKIGGKYGFYITKDGIHYKLE